MSLIKRHPEIWNCYRDLRQRHFNPRNPCYESLKHLDFTWPNFQTFCQHILDTIGSRPGNQYRLTRKDTTKPYEEDNFQWLIHSRVVRRGRSARTITYKRRTYCISELCQEYNLSYYKFRRRIKKGLTIRQAIKESQL